MRVQTSFFDKKKSLNKGKSNQKKIRKILLEKGLKASKNQFSDNSLNYKDKNININNQLNLPQINYTNRNNSYVALPSIKNKTNKNKDSFDSQKIFFYEDENDLTIGNKNEIKSNNKGNGCSKNDLNRHNKKNNKFKNNAEVKKIVNSLINSPKNNLNEFKTPYNIEEVKRKYPRENMIDPLYYIKYNISNKPLEKGLDKSFIQYIQDLEENRKEPFLLNEANGVNYGNIQIDYSKFKDNKDEKNIKNMLKQLEERKNFIFDLKDLNYYKKILRYKNVFDKKKIEKRNKKILMSKFKKLIIDTNKNKKINFIESYIDKRMNKYKSFDERMDVILKNTKVTENNINQKSKYHEKLINKINNIYKSY